MATWIASLALGVVLSAGTASDYASARRKFELIRQDKAPAGSTVAVLEPELNAYVRQESVKVAPEGLRDPRVDLGTGMATGFAYVDFPKLRKAQGQPMNWFMARLLAGEKPVRVEARIRSEAGKATVDVQRVEVSGMSITGSALDYLIRNYVWAYYPDAKVGKPFELAHGIDRLVVRPDRVDVVMAQRPAGWRRVAK
jgi:hypothetical protein